MSRKPYKGNCLQCGNYYCGEGKKFCSHLCSSIARRGKKPPSVKIECRQCKTNFLVIYKERNKKFCNRVCADNYRHENPRTKHIEFVCKYCNSKFESYRSSKRKYCSIKCHDLHKFSNTKEEAILITKKKRAQSLIGRWSNVSQRAKKKNWGCSTRNEFTQWFREQPKQCVYCDIPQETWEMLYRGHQNKFALTIDRKNNDLGYLIHNLVFACSQCNFTKSNIFTYIEMREIAQKYFKPKWQEKLTEAHIEAPTNNNLKEN